MTENVRKFEKALRESGELRRRLAEELKKIAGEGSASNDAEAMAAAEAQELDPEEMELAAGGWCFADYDCYTAWNHDTPDQKGTACFSDYECMTAYHESFAVDALYGTFVKPVEDIYDALKNLIDSFKS